MSSSLDAPNILRETSSLARSHWAGMEAEDLFLVSFATTMLNQPQATGLHYEDLRARVLGKTS